MSEVQNPYDEVGGREAVLRLSETFYDWMQVHEPELAALHERDAEGHISRRSRDRFGLFLIGWLGGPQEYVAQNGHPRLRMRHARVPIDVAQRDAWLRCMYAALEQCQVPAGTQSFLRQRFAEVADFLRNTGESNP